MNIRNIMTPLLALTAQTGLAQTAGDALMSEIYTDTVSSVYNLDDVVVTGTRTPKFLKETPVRTRVVTSEDIEKADATNIQDLLSQELPGVEFSYAMNQQTHLNFSGFGGQGVLFLVDGERLAGETLDDVDFTRLSMNGVERIEIVRGAASALYGSNAVGGVINIITEKVKEPLTLNVNARGGKHGEQRYGMAWGVGGRRWSNMLTADFNRTDNYDVHSDAEPVTRVISTVYGGKTFNFKNRTVWRPAAGISVTGSAGGFFRQVERTPDIPERYRDVNAGLQLEWSMSEDDMLKVSYAFDQYDKSDFQRIADLDIRDYSNVQNTLKTSYNHTFDDGGMLTAGADFTHDYILNTSLEGATRRQDCFALFAQYDRHVGRNVEIVGALRYDYLSDKSMARLTPKLNVLYRASRNLAIRAGYGMGFRAPALKEKYYNFDMGGIWIVEGNENLKPETSHNFNVSADYARGNYNFTASVCYNRVENKISTAAPYFKDMNDRLPYVPYVNLGNYEVYGGEIGIQARWATGFSARMTYAYTKELLPKDKDGTSVAGQYIPARAHSLVARFDYDRQLTRGYGLNIGINGRVLSGVESTEYKNYYDVSEGTVNVAYPAYTVWKLSVAQRFGKGVRLTVTLDNIFNYRPRYYYMNSPLTDGVNVQAGLSLDIEKLF